MPYQVYGGQQESGSAAVASRGNDGRNHVPRLASGGRGESTRTWRPIRLNARIRLRRRICRSGRGRAMGPGHGRGGTSGEAGGRHLRTRPVIFSYKDPHVTVCGDAVRDARPAMEARAGRRSARTFRARRTNCRPAWRRMQRRPRQQATRRGVVYSIAPSHLDVNVLWAGTDDGLIQVTRDGGKTWKNVTPAAIDAVEQGGADWIRRTSTTGPYMRPSTVCAWTT